MLKSLVFQEQQPNNNLFTILKLIYHMYCLKISKICFKALLTLIYSDLVCGMLFSRYHFCFLFGFTKAQSHFSF